MNGTAPHVEAPMNITEEMCKTSLWKTFVKDGSTKKPQSRKSKSPDKHKHKHRHHHKNKHSSRHRRARDADDGQEGLWMMSKKDGDEDGEVSDSELQRKLSTISEDKPGDVVIDMDQIQDSLLEEAEEDETADKADAEAKC